MTITNYILITQDKPKKRHKRIDTDRLLEHIKLSNRSSYYPNSMPSHHSSYFRESLHIGITVPVTMEERARIIQAREEQNTNTVKISGEIGKILASITELTSSHYDFVPRQIDVEFVPITDTDNLEIIEEDINYIKAFAESRNAKHLHILGLNNEDPYGVSGFALESKLKNELTGLLERDRAFYILEAIANPRDERRMALEITCVARNLIKSLNDYKTAAADVDFRYNPTTRIVELTSKILTNKATGQEINEYSNLADNVNGITSVKCMSPVKFTMGLLTAGAAFITLVAAITMASAPIAAAVMVFCSLMLGIASIVVMRSAARDSNFENSRTNLSTRMKDVMRHTGVPDETDSKAHDADSGYTPRVATSCYG